MFVEGHSLSFKSLIWYLKCLSFHSNICYKLLGNEFCSHTITYLVIIIFLLIYTLFGVYVLLISCCLMFCTFPLNLSRLHFIVCSLATNLHTLNETHPYHTGSTLHEVTLMHTKKLCMIFS